MACERFLLLHVTSTKQFQSRRRSCRIFTRHLVGDKQASTGRLIHSQRRWSVVSGHCMGQQPTGPDYVTPSLTSLAFRRNGCRLMLWLKPKYYSLELLSYLR